MITIKYKQGSVFLDGLRALKKTVNPKEFQKNQEKGLSEELRIVLCLYRYDTTSSEK